jgi:predicted lipoprotein with Yx(FWY)xxD motif
VRPAWARACILVTALFGLAACGGGAAGQTPEYDIQVGTVAGLGRVLVDGSGYTLYAYMPDHRGRSTCYEICARRWPPLILPPGDRSVAGPGIDPALLGTIARADGYTQITYSGWPLYLYDVDTHPGQAAGQADDMGLWYVLTPGGLVDRRTLPGG